MLLCKAFRSESARADSKVSFPFFSRRKPPLPYANTATGRLSTILHLFSRALWTNDKIEEVAEIFDFDGFFFV